MDFMKRLFGHKSLEETPSNAATPMTSPIASPATSVYENKSVLDKHDRYHNDPVRTNKHPDRVGNYFDPMGGHGSYGASTDVTNTGA
ncbi:hypothetical protein BDB01DRAFT_805224 [Pilobolus umbonatus]|nr:hypothetical protein BDB01DRAFT_805224 [Pilobolus umbonatus]